MVTKLKLRNWTVETRSRSFQLNLIFFVCIIFTFLPVALFADAATLQKARDAFMKNKKEEAIGLYKSVMNADSKSEDAYYAGYELGKLYDFSGDVKNCVATMRWIMTNFKGTVYYMNAVEELYYILIKRQMNEDAKVLLEEFLKGHPDNVRYRKDLANLHIRTGSVYDAIAEYKKVLEKDSAEYETLMTIGMIHYDLKMLDDAVIFFDKIIKSYPNNTNAYEYLGKIYLEKGENDTAYYYFNSAIEMAQYDPMRYKRVADLYSTYNLYEKAVEELTRSIKLSKDPNYIATTYYDIGQMGEKNGQYDSALESYELGLKSAVSPFDQISESIRDRIMRVYEKTDNYSGCINEYNKRVENGDTDVNNYLILGNVYIKTNDDSSAIINFAKAWDRTPGNFNLFSSIYSLYMRTNRFADAIDFCARAEPKYYGFMDFYMMFGNAYISKGDANSAIKKWYKIVEMNPNHFYFRQFVGDLLLNNGFYDSAIVEYKQALALSPGNYDILVSIANVMRRQEKVDSAVELYIDALSQMPEDALINSRIFADMMDLLEEENRTGYVFEKIRSNLDTGRRTTFSTLMVSLMYEHEGNIESAVEYIMKYSAMTKGAQTIYLWGGAFESKERFKMAIAMYRSYLKVALSDGVRINLKYRLAKCFDATGEDSPALDMYIDLYANAGNDLDRPTLHDCIYSIARLFFRTADYERALDFCNELIREHPDNAKMYEVKYISAECLMVLEFYDSAVEAYNHLISFPNNFSDKAEYMLGKASLLKGEIGEALKIFGNIAKNKPESDFANDAIDKLILLGEVGNLPKGLLVKYFRGETCLGYRLYDKAFILMDDVYMSAMNSVLGENALFSLGVLYEEKGAYNEAIAGFEKLLNDYRDSDLRDKSAYRIAYINGFRLNKHDESMKEYLKFLRDYPNSVIIDKVREDIKLLNVKKIN